MTNIFQWRYGRVYEIKPPIGLNPFTESTELQRVTYKLKRLIWKLETWIDSYLGRKRRLEIMVDIIKTPTPVFDKIGSDQWVLTPTKFFFCKDSFLKKTLS